MPTFPPSPNVPLPARLTVRSSRAEITAELVAVNRARDEFGVSRNDFQMLYDLFPPGAAGKYDLCHFGSLQRAQLLADQIPIGLHVASLLDIGSGTGNTLIRVAQTLHTRTTLRHIAFVDGHGEMIKRLMEKFEDEAVFYRTVPLDLLTSRTNNLTIMRDVRDTAAIEINFQQGRPRPNLITAEGVLEWIPKADHAQTLHDWMTLGAPGAKMIVDIPHPHKRIGLEWVGEPGILGQHLRPKNEHCFVVADEESWDECRVYAHALAMRAGLLIEGVMVAQRPVAAASKLEKVSEWVKAYAPAEITSDLTRDEFDFFRLKYMLEAKNYYRGLGYDVRYETAAVIVVYFLG